MFRVWYFFQPRIQFRPRSSLFRILNTGVNRIKHVNCKQQQTLHTYFYTTYSLVLISQANYKHMWSRCLRANLHSCPILFLLPSILQKCPYVQLSERCIPSLLPDSNTKRGPQEWCILAGVIKRHFLCKELAEKSLLLVLLGLLPGVYILTNSQNLVRGNNSAEQTAKNLTFH